MLVTSGAEVTFPCFDNFTAVFLDDFLNSGQLLFGKAFVGGKGDYGLDPEFRFPVPGHYMDMHPGFFPGKEEKPIGPFTKNSRRHAE
jgi:hypothetical protein